MKESKTNVCPGCSRHCTAETVKCKYGRNYFAKQDVGLLKVKERKKKHECKWKKMVSEDGVVRELIITSIGIKKAIRSGMITEKQIMEMLNDAEQAQLASILRNLNAKMKKREESV